LAIYVLMTIPSVLYLLIGYVMMWLAIQFLGHNVAVGIRIVAICLVIYHFVELVNVCSADPIYIPPEEGEGGEGMMIFPCEAPLGMFAYFWIYIGGPLTVVANAILVFRLIGKSNKSVGVHFNEH
jgi:hypothetical protein